LVLQGFFNFQRREPVGKGSDNPTNVGNAGGLGVGSGPVGKDPKGGLTRSPVSGKGFKGTPGVVRTVKDK
jgi:hypothetical protein